MRSVAAAIVMLALVGVAACADSDGESISDEAALRGRIDALYRAEQAGDWRAWYDMTAQAKDALSSYEEFAEAFQVGEERQFTVVSWKVIDIESLETSEDQASRYDSLARVAMDVTVRRASGVEEKEPQQTDYWAHADGQWYWRWRGFPYD